MLPAKSSTLCLLLSLSLAAADVSVVFNQDKQYSILDVSLMSVNVRNSQLAVVTSKGENYNISLTTVDSRQKSNSCRFKLNRYEYDVTGHPFNADKAILVSRSKKENQEQYVKYTVIDSRDCVKSEARINFETFDDVEDSFKENRNTILINERDTFDVFYYDVKVCGDTLCRLRINARGDKVMGPITSFVPMDSSFRYVKEVASSSNFIVTELKEFGEDYKVSLVTADGQVVLKQLHKRQEENYPSYHDVSTSHGLIRLCSKMNITKVNCDQFNHKGKLRSRITVYLAEEIKSLAVENLADGVFLLMAHGEESTSVLKVREDNGLVLGVVKLSWFSSDAHESYIDVGNDRYCVTRKIYGNYHKIKKECFADSDFKCAKHIDECMNFL